MVTEQKTSITVRKGGSISVILSIIQSGVITTFRPYRWRKLSINSYVPDSEAKKPEADLLINDGKHLLSVFKIINNGLRKKWIEVEK